MALYISFPLKLICCHAIYYISCHEGVGGREGIKEAVVIVEFNNVYLLLFFSATVVNLISITSLVCAALFSL